MKSVSYKSEKQKEDHLCAFLRSSIPNNSPTESPTTQNFSLLQGCSAVLSQGPNYKPKWILEHKCKSVRKWQPLSRYWGSSLTFGGKLDHWNHCHRGPYSLTREWIWSLNVCPFSQPHIYVFTVLGQYTYETILTVVHMQYTDALCMSKVCRSDVVTCTALLRFQLVQLNGPKHDRRWI